MYLMKRPDNFDIGKVSLFLKNALEFLDAPLMSPVVDDHISLKGEEYNTEYKLAVPGYSKEDIRITKKGDKLLIYIKDKIVKSLFLTKSIDKENIKTSVKNGVLTLDFSKAFDDNEEEIQIE